MNDILTSLSNQLAEAVDKAAASVVQVHGRRPAAGVVFAPDLVLAPANALDEDLASVRAAGGATHDGIVLGRAFSTNLAVVRVAGLGLTPLELAPDPKVGHVALAVGRTWSGGVMATLTNVAVIGGPLRTSRTSAIERVIRIAQPPHGALVGGPLIDGAGRAIGIITATDIRRTTVVIPATLAWAMGQAIVQQGGSKQGFLGVSSSTIAIPEKHRAGRAQAHGLLVSGLVEGGPAETAGLLLGDIIVGFDGQPVDEPEALITLLRADRGDTPATLTIIRGGEVKELAVTIGERPVGESRGRTRR